MPEVRCGNRPVRDSLRASRLRLLCLSALFFPCWSTGPFAQDGGLDGLLFVPFLEKAIDEEQSIEDVEGRSIEIYRIPLSYEVRGLEDHPWGLRITFPVTLSSYRITALTDLDEFIAGAEAVSIIPGVEFQLPVGRRWQLKPFAEVGIGSSTSGDTEALFGAGMKTRGAYSPGRSRVTLGGAAVYKQPATSRTEYDGYSRLEFGIDGQWPLGFSLGSRSARGGVYGIARRFFDLDLEQLDEQPIELKRQYELGLSFSADPPVRLWKAEFPWFGLGYQFGEVTRGVRLYLAFPF